MSEPISNPYKKGKSKLIADLMLEGWSNDKIYNHIHDHKLDERFNNPVSMDNIYQVRTRFKQKGIMEKMKERQERQEPQVVTPSEEPLEIPEGRFAIDVYAERKRERELAGNEGKVLEQYPPAGRPEWNLLTIEQVNDIEDPALRTKILEYKSYREKIKQEVTPDYATREQFDLFKKEVQGGLSDLKESISATIVETLNKLKKDNPGPEVALVEEPIDPALNLETENLLDDAESVIELKGNIISRKSIGFTSKSLLLFDLVRKKGFKGNLADFVNSSISSAMKGRNFKLVVEEDVE
jgi:hypothetical protein